MISAVDLYVQQSNELGAKRGWTSSGDANGTLVPNAIWGDAIIFYAGFMGVTMDPTECLADQLSVSPFSSWSQLFLDMGGHRLSASVSQCLTFLQSDAFRSAPASFQAVDPSAKAWATWGDQTPVALPAAIFAEEIYPYNAEFWTAAGRYAIARSAAGAVQGDQHRFADAVTQSVKDLPETIQEAIDAVNPLPDGSWWKTFAKVTLGLGAAIGVVWAYKSLRGKD